MAQPAPVVTSEEMPAETATTQDETSLTTPVSTSTAGASSATEMQDENVVVKSIEVKGNKAISIATVLSKIKTRVGQEYLQAVVSDDIKRLYNTGYFSDVRVDKENYEGGLKVVINIEEKPIIEEITFSKTRYLKSRALVKKLKSQVGKFLDNKSLKDDEETIKDLYAKKGLTSATVEVETFVDEATNKASLHIVVREGQKIRTRRINIFGNLAFSDSKILHVIKSRPKSLFTSGYYNQELVDEDMDRITSFYEQQGYIDATAQYSVEQLYEGRININVEIAEGKRYFVGGVNVSGSNIISNKEIFNAMESIKEGNIFSREKLSVDISRIRALYFDRGYIFAEVNEATSLDPTTGKVDVKIDIKEGGLAYIEKVKIQGNTRTRDIVIRRELKMYPGDRFDGAKLKRSKERLSNLGYFEDVSFDMDDTDTYDRKNLIVQVKEAKTGTFSFGGGFSTVDKVIGFIEIEQRNFDFTNWPNFTGGGQNLQLRAETGSTRNNVRLSFTEPWLFDYPVSGGFDAYLSQRDRDSDIGFAYDERRVGGVIRFGKQFNEYVNAGISFKNERVSIRNLDTGVSAALLAEEGTNTVRTVGLSMTRDTTDSQINPTKGLVLNGSIDVAGGVLGADKDFYRTQFRASYYIPLKWKSVIELNGRVGIVDEYGDSATVPIFERFFAGGARTIRGYNERKVGPLDPSNGDPIGGESLFLASVEYTIPVVEYIKVAAFFDTGNVWDQISDFGQSDLKSGAGFGLRFKTPVGPINLDYGFPLNDEPGEEKRTGKFYFSVSRGF